MNVSNELSLVNYFKASFPYMLMNTYEPSRAIEAYEEDYIEASKTNELLGRTNNICFEWRLTSGFEVRLKDSDIFSNIVEMDEFTINEFVHNFESIVMHLEEEFDKDKKTKFTLFVHLECYEDIKDFFDEVMIDQIWCNIEKVTGIGTIVFIHPIANVPKILEHEIGKYIFALPNQEERLAKVRFQKHIQRENGRDMPDNNDDIISAENMAGLTATEGNNLLYLSVYGEDNCRDFDAITIKKYRTSLINSMPGLTIYEGNDNLSDVGGHMATKEWFKNVWRPEIINNAKIAPRGALCIGVPGSGKTMLAQSLGNYAKVPTIEVNIGDLFGSYVGESEKNAKKAFEIIEAIGKCIVLIDEMDKSFSGDAQGEVSKRVFGTFLKKLNDAPLGTFFLGTANDMASLVRAYPELVRPGRWDRLWFFDFPDLEERKEIFSIYIDYFDLTEKQQSEVPINSEQWTGAEIKQCCKEAAQMGCTLREAAKYIIPIAETGKEAIERTKEWARGKCLSSKTGRSYDPDYSRPLSIDKNDKGGVREV